MIKEKNMMRFREEYNNWIGSDSLTAEEKENLRQMSEEEIHEAFYKDVEFGTAGMRGIMGLGTNRLNRYTIRMAAKGLAEMLKKHAGLYEGKTPSVAIAYDTRNNSRDFARETAAVLAAAGVKAYLFDRYSPVPLLSFAVRELGCNGGVVITASHNTSEYNGFKVYDETGCQMKPEAAGIIAANMRALENPLAIETADINDTNMVEIIGEELCDRFLKTIRNSGMGNEAGYDDEEAANALGIVYTPIHGAGRDFVMSTLNTNGFIDLTLVKEQAEFDGNFPTVKKPNPEDAEALEKAAEIAVAEGKDIIIGTDPDCDRIGVGVIDKSGDKIEVKYLTGNETGALLIDYLSRFAGDAERKHVITTIVTGEMGPAIAQSKGIIVDRTLTGFKYIGEIMNSMEAERRDGEFLIGYEESYGYLTGLHARDKDAVSAALAICRMAAYHKAAGKTLTDVLEELRREHGYWIDSQESLVYEGAAGEQKMKEIMERLRKSGSGIFRKFVHILGIAEYTDYSLGADGLDKADVLKYIFEDKSWVAVRPSGTEPKIKIYYCIRGENREEAKNKMLCAAECMHGAC